MQVRSDRRPDFRHTSQVVSGLAPETLFDLLADPRGCLSWHVHPQGVEILSIDAAPGAALEGAEIVAESTMRGVPVSTRTRVTEAVRPSVYATYSETVFPPRLAYKKLIATERYVLEPNGTGSRIGYEVTAIRELRGFPYIWPILKINDRFFARAGAERCFVDFIRAAERHAGIAA